MGIGIFQLLISDSYEEMGKSEDLHQPYIFLHVIEVEDGDVANHWGRQLFFHLEIWWILVGLLKQNA